MSSLTRHLFLFVVALGLFVPRISFADDSASAAVSVTATITSGLTIDTKNGDKGELQFISWSYFGGNPDEFAKAVLITVQDGPSWNYTEYVFYLKEPHHWYHAETFDPKNYLEGEDPHKERAMVALMQTNEVMDPNYFVQTQEALAAIEVENTGSEKPWQQPGTLIRSFI